jgi:hypothetical protein
MVTTESKAIEGKIQEAVNQPLKKTRGEVARFNRARWFFMKKHFPYTDNQLAAFRIAACPAKVNGKEATLVCYFKANDAEEKGLAIENYENLNEHPDLIIYEGYEISGKNGETIVQKRDGEKSFLEEKIIKGEITEVGVVTKELTTRKVLNSLGNFMIMGGFVMIILLVIVITVVIGLLKG